MKDNKKMKRIPRYAFGANAIGNWSNLSGVERADAVTQGIGAVGLMFNNATSGNPVTLGGVLSGIGSGASAGAAIGGPIGAIAGGALGGITSSIGTGGSVNLQTGEITKPSGISGLFGHSKRWLRNESGKIKNGIQARQNSELLAAQYYLNNGYNHSTFAEGGTILHTNAYLDDGEIIRTPDGMILQIPEEGKPTDSNLVTVPVGTQVLSDKLKVPGTNKTFAEMGKKLMKPNNKKANDIYAKNSQMLNEINNQIEYQKLLDLQESLKKDKKDNTNSYAKGSSGIKRRKVKVNYVYNPMLGGFGYYDTNTGGFVNMNDVPNQNLPDSIYVADYDGVPDETYDFSEEPQDTVVDFPKTEAALAKMSQRTDSIMASLDSTVQDTLNQSTDNLPSIRKKGFSQLSGKRHNKVIGNNLAVPVKSNYKESADILKNQNTDVKNALENNKPQYYAERKLPLFEVGPAIRSGLVRAGWAHGTNKDYNFNYNIEIPELNYRTNSVSKPVGSPSVTPKQDTVVEPVAQQSPRFVKEWDNKPSLTSYASKPDIMFKKAPTFKSAFKPKFSSDTQSGFSFPDLYPTLATLAPLFDRDKSERVDTYTYNPVYGPTEYNINPMINEAILTDRIARRNIANINPNTGAGMAFGLLSAVNRNRAIANAYSAKNNAENQLAFQNAGIANQWGQQYANARHLASVEQAQNDAAARNYNRSNTATALRNLGQITRDRRQQEMDLAAYEMMKPMFEYGTENETINKINRLINRRRNG